MNIVILDKYRITTIPQNFVVHEKHVSKTGKISWKNDCYYTSIESALKAILTHLLIGGDQTTLEEIRLTVATFRAAIADVKDTFDFKLDLGKA